MRRSSGHLAMQHRRRRKERLGIDEWEESSESEMEEREEQQNALKSRLESPPSWCPQPFVGDPSRPRSYCSPPHVVHRWWSSKFGPATLAKLEGRALSGIERGK